MVIFKNTLTTLLAEAEDDGGFGDPMADDQNENEETEGSEESMEEETTEEDNKEETEQNDEDTENIVRNNKELDRTLEDNQINTLNLIFDEIDKAQEQLDYLILRGKILSLSADKVANVYNKLQSKLLHLIGLYEQMLNKNL